MKTGLLITVLLLLGSCAGVHHSFHSRRKTRIKKVRVSHECIVADTKKAEGKSDFEYDLSEHATEQETVLIKQEATLPVSDEPIEEDLIVFDNDENTESVENTDKEPEVGFKEELNADRRKFNKNFLYTLISAAIGYPIGVTVSVLTFNPIVLMCFVPFMIAAGVLAGFQVFKLSDKVPLENRDTKYFRRALFADIVLIITAIIAAIVLLAAFAAL